MQEFTNGDVTVSVAIEYFRPHFGDMSGYYCKFTWWLSIDGVEYVSGESAMRDEWAVDNASGAEGWDFLAALDRVDVSRARVQDELDAVVVQVLGWFTNLREDIVDAWMNTVNEYVERANEHGDSRPAALGVLA